MDRDTVNVIVAECFDGWLSDARALAVRPEHALEAIAAASPDEAGEGAVGAGTGTSCFGYKAGIGGASRRTEAHVLGCLVCSNYGSRRDLHLLLGAGGRGRRRPAEPPGAGWLDRDRAGHRRAADRAPAAPPGGARRLRAGASRRASPPTPAASTRWRSRRRSACPIAPRPPSFELRSLARRLAGDARAVRGRGGGRPRGGAELALRGGGDGGARRPPPRGAALRAARARAGPAPRSADRRGWRRGLPSEPPPWPHGRRVRAPSRSNAARRRSAARPRRRRCGREPSGTRTCRTSSCSARPRPRTPWPRS